MPSKLHPQTSASRLFMPLLLMMALCSTPAIATAEPALPVPGVRTMNDIPGAHELPDPKLDYKIVFDVQMLADKPNQPSDALEFIAGLMNTFSKYGVPASHMHFVAVFHGKTVALVANDETYKARAGAPENPNKDILNKLVKAGVELVVCGQSAQAQNYSPNDLLGLVRLNLSATVTFINLQTRGYIKVSD